MNKAEVIREHYRAIGKKGAKVRWDNATTQEKEEHGRIMAKARWGKSRNKKINK